jgi:cell division protein FtsL
MLVNRQQEWVTLPQEEQVEKNVTAPKTRPDSGLKRKYLQLIVLLAAVAMIVTVQSESLVRSGYNLVELKQQAAKLEKENELLRLDIAKMKSPERIEQIATQNMGMVVPKNTYYVAGTKSVTSQSSPQSAQTEQTVSLVNKAEASKAQ